jgi:uncharacterized protein YndB with AHSA1/START domain
MSADPGSTVPTGLTRDVGWEIGVSRTFPCDVDHAWRTLTEGEGLAVWLAPVGDLPTAKGEAYRTADGTAGEVRSHRPGDRLRLTWRPPGWDHDSTVQVAVTAAAGGRAVVRFHQERLAGPDEREEMRAHWAAALDALAPLLAS